LRRRRNVLHPFLIMLNSLKKNKQTGADKAPPGDWSPRPFRPFRRSDPVSPSPSPPLISCSPMMSSNFVTIPEDSSIFNCDVQEEPPDWAAGVKGLEEEISRLRELDRGFKEEISQLRELDQGLEKEIAQLKRKVRETRIIIDIHQEELVKWRKNIPST
jgi:hypothetical protein